MQLVSTAPAAADSADDAPKPGAYSALALLLAINLLNYIDREVLSGVAQQIQAEYNVSDAEIGLLKSAFLISYMVAAPVFGWLADRYRRWALIGVGVLLWSLATGASGLAATYWAMFACRVFVGIGEAAYGPAAPTVISDMFPVARRGTIMAWFYAAIPVGSALGFLMAGAVLAKGYSWHYAFLIATPPGLLLGAWALLRSDPARESAGGAAPRHATTADYWLLASIPSYVLNTAGMAAMTFALGGVSIWMVKYIVWRRALAGEFAFTDTQAVNAASAEAAGLFGPILVVSGLSATILGGIVGDRLRPRLPGSYFVVSGVAMLLAFPLFVAMTLTPFPAAWVLVFAACFLLFFNTGPTNTALANTTPPEIRSAAFALNILLIHAFGDVPSPPLIGLINDFSVDPNLPDGKNMNVGFWAVSGSILLSGVLWLWASRYLQADTAAATTLLAPAASEPLAAPRATEPTPLASSQPSASSPSASPESAASRES